MSRKINTFASFITQPLNTYNFRISIKSLTDKVDDNVTMVVESASVPSEKMRTMELSYQGEKISYPAKPELGGEWQITIPENDRASVKRELDRLKNKMYDQKTGMMSPSQWYTVEVHQLDLSDNIVFSCVLHGCWIVGRDSMNLKTDDVSTSYKWQYTFKYQWIEDIDASGVDGTPNPFKE